MKHLLYIFLVLAALFAAIYLLPERSPLFEYYRLRPIFEISSILLLIVVLYLYRREKRQVKMIFSRLSQKNFFLDLAIQCGGIYIWEFKDEEFFFKYPVGDQPSRIELEEMWKLIHPDDLIAFKLQRQSLWKADKEVFQCRARFAGSDYEWWEFRFSAMPALDNAEGGKDVSGILININDMKKREKELILMRGYEQKFLANMSHEIRTPLNAIVGFSQLLNSDMPLEPEEKAEFIDLITKNSDLLLKLINDILDLSRIESGSMSFSYENLDLSKLMGDIFHTHQLMMPEGVELKIRVPHEPLIIRSDHFRLTQVCTNFINNAVKFTAKGYIEIGYELSADGKSILISVKDTGKGIPDDKKEKVFERFQKLDEFAQGTGLGLAICQSIVHTFHGSISLESEVGVGSKFTISLPYTPGLELEERT